MVKVIIDLPPFDIARLEKIGRDGIASNGFSQDFHYCLRKAVTDFIKKYKEELKE